MNIHPQKLAELRQAVADARAADPDDDELLADMLDGADFGEIVARCFQSRREALASKGAMEDLAGHYRARAGLFETRAERIGHLLGRLRDLSGQNIKHPLGSVIVSERKPDVERAEDFDVKALPDDLVRVKREPDMAKIKEAVKAGRNVPGVRWGSPKRVTQIRG